MSDELYGTTAADSGFPSEAFPCPACGQMLGAACRVCVACKKPVDFAQLARPETPAIIAEPQTLPPPAVRVRYPWPILLFVLVVWFFAASVAARFLSPLTSQIVMGGLVVLSSFWVFNDARARGVPKPWRWGIACLLFWIVFFPWYLARRKAPEASCPFIESERGPLLRFLLVTLVVFVLVNIVLALFKVPSPLLKFEKPGSESAPAKSTKP